MSKTSGILFVISAVFAMRSAAAADQAQMDRIVAAVHKDAATQSCLRRNAPHFQSIDIDDPNALADLVTACAQVARAFVAAQCASQDADCRAQAGAAMLVAAREAIEKARASRR
jgi:hypothetical protein